jgi:YidC/Oxa1 family membrane protein insertase
VEKRFVVFIILTMIIIVGYNMVLTRFGPKKPPPNAKAQADAKKAAEEKEKDKTKPDTTEEKRATEKTNTPSLPTAEKPGVATTQPPSPHRVVTLGSYQANNSSPLLVTLNTRGAALERVELVGRDEKGHLRYRDLENTGGYIGNLSLVAEAPTGCRVLVIPPGTPAASAESQAGIGLKIDDIILNVDGKKVAAPRDVEDQLARLKPKDSVKLTVERKVDGQIKAIDFTAILAERPFQLIRPEPLEAGELRPHPLSMLLSTRNALTDQEPFVDALHNVDWEIKELAGEQPGIEFRYVVDQARASEFGLTGSAEILKRYRLGSPTKATEAGASAKSLLPYHLDFELEIRNLAEAPQKIAYRLLGTNGLPTEGWWYLAKIHPAMFAGAGARDIVLRSDYDTGGAPRLFGCPAIFSKAKKDEKSPETPLISVDQEMPKRSLQHIGVDTQYFAAALKPISKKANESVVFARADALVLGDITKKPKGWERTANVTYRLDSPPLNLEPQASWRQQFILYTGPKDPGVLANYKLSEFIYYGWFGGIAKFLSAILHFFHDRMIGNYAIAIIMLTVLVRGCMFPISRKAAKNAAMMQELAPEMKKIAEKYKNNMEARGKAQQELFRKHNYNPLSGCWMMFLQLPVFMGLYRSLAVDIELRQAPFIHAIEWASNLAGPDKLFYWKSDFSWFLTDESGWIGPYFNLLPIFTIALFLLQQKMFTPPATDEQTAMQLKMMKYMTVFMGVLFYKVPAGLCVYFITSSLWGIAERKLLPKPKPKPPNQDPPGDKSFSFLSPFSPKPDENGSSRKKMAKRPKRK